MIKLQITVHPAELERFGRTVSTLQGFVSMELAPQTMIEQAVSRFTLVNGMDHQRLSFGDSHEDLLQAQLLLILLEAQALHCRKDGTLYEVLRHHWPREWDRAKARVSWTYGLLRKRLKRTNYPLVSSATGFYGFEWTRLRNQAPPLVLAPKQEG